MSRGRNKKLSTLRSQPRVLSIGMPDKEEISLMLNAVDARPVFSLLSTETPIVERRMNLDVLMKNIEEQPGLLSRMILGHEAVEESNELFPEWLNRRDELLTKEQQAFLIKACLVDSLPQLILRRNIIENYFPASPYSDFTYMHEVLAMLSKYNKFIAQTAGNYRFMWSHHIYRDLLKFNAGMPHPTGLLELFTSYKTDVFEQTRDCDKTIATAEMWAFMKEIPKQYIGHNSTGWHHSARGAFYKLIKSGESFYQWDEQEMPDKYEFNRVVNKIKAAFKEEYGDKYLPIADLDNPKERINGSQLHSALMSLKGKQRIKPQ